MMRLANSRVQPLAVTLFFEHRMVFTLLNPQILLQQLGLGIERF